ncbi:MAG: FeoA family protein [Desulfosporosinus sp.]|nr:FeoA family protein [Desulfosporosinus sp.]
MLLTMLPPGKEAKIIASKANDSTKKFLEALGIIPGVTISVVSERKGNLIVNVKGSRLALNRGTAHQLFVQV